MEIKWLRMALNNLDQEAEFIARDDPRAAKQVVLHIHRSVALLLENPGLGHVGRVHGTRELVIPDTQYIVPYRVRPRLERIEILRVFHSSRKLPRHW